jgi:hypothetical protein
MVLATTATILAWSWCRDVSITIYISITIIVVVAITTTIYRGHCFSLVIKK